MLSNSWNFFLDKSTTKFINTNTIQTLIIEIKKECEYKEDIMNDYYENETMIKNLENIRYIPNQKERLYKIGKIFQEFEEEYYFIPLFQMYYPYILYKKDIHVPKANYYYESELWKLHWKEEAKN